MIFILSLIIIALGLAIPPLFLGMYNYPGRFICAICDYPYGCTSSDEVDCKRGEGGVTYSNYSHGYTVFCAVIMITFVCLLVYEIYQQEKRTDRFLTIGQEQRRVNTSKTVWRGIQFIGVYFFSYFPSFVALGYRASGNLDIPDVFDNLFVILLPLLGFFNTLVYFRPRYLACKKSNPDSSWIVCMSYVLKIRATDPNLLSSMLYGDSATRRWSSTSMPKWNSGSIPNISSVNVQDIDGERADHGNLPVDDNGTDHEGFPSPLVRDSVETWIKNRHKGKVGKKT